MPPDDTHDEFIRLLTEHQSSLKAYIASLIPGLPGVNDVLQETNLTLWRKRDKFRPGSNFTAWSFAVARFAVFEHRRKARRGNLLIFSDELTDALAFSHDELVPELSNARYAALQACLAKLSEAHRDLVHLRYETPTTIEEFARSTGRNPGSLRVILHQVRSKLRRCINLRLRQAGTTQ